MSPIYDFSCDVCKGIKRDVFQRSSRDRAECCGVPMRKLPTGPAMVKMKGMGGYPSARKARLRNGGTNLQEDDRKRKVWV